MILDQYKRAFSKLRSDVKAYWPAATLHRAPHKPFLLLSIMDLIANNRTQTNHFELNTELIDTFDIYWKKIVGDDRESNILMPFYHLTSESFWRLVPIPGMEEVLPSIGKIKSYQQFHQVVLGARLDDDLFALLSMPDSRDDLRKVLIEKYFTPEARAEIVSVGRITAQSFEYSRELIDRLKGRFILKEAPETTEIYLTESRTAAFRRVVVDAYQHTCSFCRIRMRTPDGHTAVAAAHIVPWSHGHNDDPRNGMALCGLHHWAFDRGLMAVEDYRLKVSPVAKSDDNIAPSVLELDDRPIYLPNDQIRWPAKSALRWHMENIFWEKVPPRLL